MVIISRGPWTEMGQPDGLELMWEDGSDAPFCIQMLPSQYDRLIPDTDQGGGFQVVAWTRAGVEQSSLIPQRSYVSDALLDQSSAAFLIALITSPSAPACRLGARLERR